MAAPTPAVASESAGDIATPRLNPLDGYQLHLPSFEGPLDVLLRLIERDQLPISEISLLSVLDQFLAYMETLASPSPDAIADFASVAGRLSVLKSRALLPQPDRAEEAAEDEVDLVRQLEDYRRLKQAAQVLADLQRSGSGGFGRGEAVVAPEAPPRQLLPQQPGAIRAAVVRWLSRVPAKPVEIGVRRVVTLREMVTRIFTALARSEKVSFTQILATCDSRSDVAVAFLGALTLMRRHVIEAEQLELFGPIWLTRVQDDGSSFSPVATDLVLENPEMVAAHG
jgi:segregation and condensation protein A